MKTKISTPVGTLILVVALFIAIQVINSAQASLIV